MEVKRSFHKKVLNPCGLEWFNYQIDTYIGCEHFCKYCYGLNNAVTNWEKEIIIHKDIIEQLNEELDSLKPQIIYIGMNSDPYQQSEKDYCQTREVLKMLKEKHFSVCILTKSGLVLRDIDLLTKMSAPSVGVSMAFQNEDTRQLFEKNAPSNLERIKTLKKLKSAGIETYTMISPVIPFFTDINQIIEMVEPYSDTIWIYRLQMESDKEQNWRNLSYILGIHFPEKVNEFKEIVFSNDHKYWNDIKNEIEEIKNKKDININLQF